MAPSRLPSKRVPFEDLTNTTDYVQQTTQSTSAASNRRSDASNEKKRQRERERYAAMSEEQRSERNRKRRENISDEKRSDMNKKRRQRYKENNKSHADSGANLDVQSTVANTPEEAYVQNDMHTVQCSQELTDDNLPDEADDQSDWLHRQTEHSVGGAPDLTGAKTPDQSDDRSDGLHRQTEHSVASSQDLTGRSVLGHMDDTNFHHELGVGDEATLRAQRREYQRQWARTRSAAMSPEQRNLINKKRRDQRAAKNKANNVVKRLPMSPQKKKEKK